MTGTQQTPPIRLGLIGCGGRGAGMARVAASLDTRVRITHIADPDADGARQRLGDLDLTDSQFHTDHEALLACASELDGLIIATRCHLHTPIAVAAARTGLPIFLEKPVAIDTDQLAALWTALGPQSDRVVVSFPLRVTPVFLRVMEIIRTGRLGTINQVDAFNYVNYGGVYFGGHYRNYDETRGLWLQKATHDFDYLNVMLEQAAPQAIAAMATQTIYGGDMPHDLQCSRCDKARTCPEGPTQITLRGDSGGMDAHGYGNDPNVKFDHACAYSREIRNQDAGSALIRYSDGVHAAYSQNFVSRRSAHRRGARITGYLGTLEFDFGGDIRVVEHHRNVVENMTVTASGSHGGGDDYLLRNFLAVIAEGATSCAPLRAGIISATMSLAATASCEAGSFEAIAMP